MLRFTCSSRRWPDSSEADPRWSPPRSGTRCSPPLETFSFFTTMPNALAATTYADNYLIDVKFGIIMHVEASRAIRQPEVGAAKTSGSPPIHEWFSHVPIAAIRCLDPPITGGPEQPRLTGRVDTVSECRPDFRQSRARRSRWSVGACVQLGWCGKGPASSPTSQPSQQARRPR